MLGSQRSRTSVETSLEMLRLQTLARPSSRIGREQRKNSSDSRPPRDCQYLIVPLRPGETRQDGKIREAGETAAISQYIYALQGPRGGGRV